MEGWRLDLQGVLCEGVNFSELPLNGANFGNAQLEWANFWKAQLEGANFQRARIADANFEGASLINEQGVGPYCADVLGWGDIDLATTEWGVITQLGDEMQARKKKFLLGESRLKLYQSAMRAYRQLATAVEGRAGHLRTMSSKHAGAAGQPCCISRA